MWDFRRMLLNQESSKKATAPAVAFIILLITRWSCTCTADVQAFLEIEAKG